MDQIPLTSKSLHIYKQPHEISLADLDPLIGPVVIHINQSNWVWTVESCQGHPDSEKPAWANNARPMLRLLCRHEDQGALCFHLLESVWWYMNKYPDYHHGLEIIPTGRAKAGDVVWAESLVYLQARIAYERNIGIEILDQFAGRLCGDSRASQAKEKQA